MLEGEAVAGHLDGADWLQACKHALGTRSVDFTGDSTRDQLSEQGVETTGRPVAGSPQVVVALGQEAQHLDVVASLDGGQLRGSKCGHRHRVGVVGIVLVGPPAAQHPDPGGQSGGHVEDLLAGGNQLLREQVAKPTGRLDDPGALVERTSPAE